MYATKEDAESFVMEYLPGLLQICIGTQECRPDVEHRVVQVVAVSLAPSWAVSLAEVSPPLAHHPRSVAYQWYLGTRSPENEGAADTTNQDQC